MALHGDLRVNGRAIAEWSAVRKHEVPAEVETHSYACEVCWTAAPRSILTFSIEHPVAHGATVLAASVLMAAAEEIARLEASAA